MLPSIATNACMYQPFTPPAPAPAPQSQPERLARLAHSMQRTDQWTPAQTAGRRWTIGCVSLEITQRCNLDCTLCYLSDSAEAVRDIPLEDLFRRIDGIAAQYGPNTDVQISGGDPTLRDRAELSQIVRYVRARGLRASLLTNGILLTRDWLRALASDGLNDVAFHVDMTQERKGYTCEADMNALRLRYINMARGLPVSVLFNTTVFAGNMHEIAGVVNFFVQHNDVVRFASFQLGADTGRGTVPGRDPVAVTQESVCQALSAGAGVPLNFDALQGGQRACNRYAMLVRVGDQRFDALADGEFAARVMRDTADVAFERDQGLRGAWALGKALLGKRHLWRGFLRLGLRYIIRKLDEPRVHFALDCSAVLCPVLPRFTFTAEALNDELDRETRRFFARPQNLRVDDARQTVFLNEILKFYTEDFVPEHARTLIGYAQRYVSDVIATGYATAFTSYDWTIANSQRKREWQGREVCKTGGFARLGLSPAIYLALASVGDEALDLSAKPGEVADASTLNPGDSGGSWRVSSRLVSRRGRLARLRVLLCTDSRTQNSTTPTPMAIHPPMRRPAAMATAAGDGSKNDGATKQAAPIPMAATAFSSRTASARLCCLSIDCFSLA